MKNDLRYWKNDIRKSLFGSHVIYVMPNKHASVSFKSAVKALLEEGEIKKVRMKNIPRVKGYKKVSNKTESFIRKKIYKIIKFGKNNLNRERYFSSL